MNELYTSLPNLKTANPYFFKLFRNTCVWVSLLKKRLQHRHFSVSFAKFLRTPFLSEHLRWLLLLFWLWNHVLSQQQKNKVRFAGSLCGGVAGGSGEASSFGWFLGGFRWFLLVAGDIRWFQVVCCFSSYTNFTRFRRVVSLLYSWTHVIDCGHSGVLFKLRQQEKDYCCLVA